MATSPDFSRGMLLSAGIHFTLAVIAFVGLPDWFNKKIEPQPLVISLEQLPITDRTNVQKSQQPIVQQQKPLPPPAKKPPTPPTSKPKAATPPPPAEKPEPVKEEPKEEVKPEAIPEKKVEQKPTPPKEKPKPTPTPPKPKPAPAKEPAKEEVMEDEALKNLINEAISQDSKEKTPPAKETAPAQNLTKSEAAYDASLPLSISEKDAITSQFVQCWRLPAGAANDYSLKVSIDVWLRPDGSVVKAYLTSDQRGRYNTDSVYRAAADSALRAVHMCSPLKNLPTNKYNSWKEMRLNFDPSMQLY